MRFRPSISSDRDTEEKESRSVGEEILRMKEDDDVFLQNDEVRT
jgi:hypothetical protein